MCSTQACYISNESTQTGYQLTDLTETKCVWPLSNRACYVLADSSQAKMCLTVLDSSVLYRDRHDLNWLYCDRLFWSEILFDCFDPSLLCFDRLDPFNLDVSKSEIFAVHRHIFFFAKTPLFDFCLRSCKGWARLVFDHVLTTLFVRLCARLFLVKT